MAPSRRVSARILTVSFAQFLLLSGASEPGLGSASTYAFESLRQPLTARQTAWGGPAACGEDGPATLRGNPAGLGAVPGTSFALSHQTWQSGLQHEWSGGALPLGIGGLGFEIAATHAGSLPAYDESGKSLGSFQPLELVIGAGYGAPLASRVRLGIAGHALSLSAPDGGMRAFAVDVGTEVDALGGVVGFVLRNLGPAPRGEGDSYRLPTELACGAQRAIGSRGRISLTAVLDRDGSRRIAGGGRLAGPGGLALLAGVLHEPESADRPTSIRGGLELEMRAVRVSYAFVPDAELGATHHISLDLTPRGSRSAFAAPIDESAVPSVSSRETPAACIAQPARPGPERWSVWGGTHRDREGAEAEVRALLVESVTTASVVEAGDGTYRVRVASDLTRSVAASLAHRLRATAALE